MYHASVNVSLIEENVIHISSGITIIVDVSVENVMYVKKIVFGILPHVVLKMENIQQVLWMLQQLGAMKLYDKETKKNIPKILMRRK